jgi:sulfur carrier protein
MKIMLNGEPVDSAAPTILLLLNERGIDPSQSGIAVAVNSEVVTRVAWETRALAEGDDVEVITAMQGG